MVKIVEVQKHSKAARHGIRPGDILVSIDGHEIRDVLDYRFYLSECVILLSLLRGEKTFTVRIKKEQYDDIGLSFATPLMDEKHTCKNGCIFCFIDQNPKGMRESIYFKDDDSRLSFLHGNYITLTNMKDEDIERIVKMRFSPVNVSIHTTNPDLRVSMMKNKRAGEVLKYLSTLADAGISICGQIVLCRGVNDGAELERTLSDLASYYPAMRSVSIVPAGLTAHRDGLYPLTDFSAEEAKAVIKTVQKHGDFMKEKYGERVFFAADELFQKAGLPIPEQSYYEDYPQIENGVGMIRSFTEEFLGTLATLDEEKTAFCPIAKELSIATGYASYPMMQRLIKALTDKYPQITVHLYPVKNAFFGESITVSGLLTGKDIAEQLRGKPLGEYLLIPKNTLRAGEDVFLCGMTVLELSKTLGVPVCYTENDGSDFLYNMVED